MALNHDGTGWPWPYRAEQRIALTHRGIGVEITIDNLHASAAMPCGVGLDPFFARTPESRIAAIATARWRNDETGLAVAEVADDRFSAKPTPIIRDQGSVAGLRVDRSEES